MNPLCAEIKSHPEGIQGICPVGHQLMARQARGSGKTFIEPCTPGLPKICTSVFHHVEFVGIVGGCGRVFAYFEVDSFIVREAINVPLKRVESMASEVA
ncbi:MAG: hypothetical protein V3571_15410 [Pseudodesulfovibrio sp.]